MIKDFSKWQAFEKELIKKANLLKKILKIFEEMYKQALFLKCYLPKNPLEGIEKDIILAKVINSV